MLFFSNRIHRFHHLSNQQAFLFTIGLLIVIGFGGGQAALIFGLVKNNLIFIIVGAAVLGISIILASLFIVPIRCCSKNNNVDSDTNPQRHPQQQKPSHQTKYENSLQKIKVVSTIQKYDKTNDLKTQALSLGVPMESEEEKNYGFSKQITQPLSTTSSFTFRNENNQSRNSSNFRQHYYDRH